MVKFRYYNTKACYTCPKWFFKIAGNQITTNFIYLTSWNFVTISHINYWDQVNSWKNLWKFWNGPLCRNKLGPFPLLNVVVYCQSSDIEACAKKLSQILANNIDNGGRGIGLRIDVRYCRYLWLATDLSVDTFSFSFHPFLSYSPHHAHTQHSYSKNYIIPLCCNVGLLCNVVPGTFLRILGINYAVLTP